MTPPNVPPVQTMDGAKLLDELLETFTRYVVFPSTEAAYAVTLYDAATHAQSAWEHATRLVIKSPLKRCGKTRLQEIISETCHHPFRTANASTAALVRSLARYSDDPPTLILDEADTIFGGKKAAKDGVAEDLRGVINAGHSRGWPYMRWNPAGKDGGELEECPTFAMAVLGGIGSLPDTIEDRAVVISMRRRAPGETVASFRRRDIPPLHDLRDRLHEWITRHTDVLAAAEPALPVEDREADVWEPLFSVAALAGGPWPARARAACLALAGGDDPDGDTIGERLLADLYDVWDAGEPELFTSTILERLWKIDEAPWSEWGRKQEPITARPLAGLLKPYGIRSKNIRFRDTQAKGYLREDLADAWQRYVPNPAQGGDASHASQRPNEGESAGHAGDGYGTQSEFSFRPSTDQHGYTTWDGGTDGTHTPYGTGTPCDDPTHSPRYYTDGSYRDCPDCEQDTP